MFASPHWTVRAPTTVLPAVDTAQALPTVPGTLSHGRAIVPILLSAVETEAATGDQEGRVFAPAVFQQVLQGPQPSLQWPSDHFMVFATLALPSCSL